MRRSDWCEIHTLNDLIGASNIPLFIRQHICYLFFFYIKKKLKRVRGQENSCKEKNKGKSNQSFNRDKVLFVYSALESLQIKGSKVHSYRFKINYRKRGALKQCDESCDCIHDCGPKYWIIRPFGSSSQFVLEQCAIVLQIFPLLSLSVTTLKSKERTLRMG